MNVAGLLVAATAFGARGIVPISVLVKLASIGVGFPTVRYERD